MSGLTERAVAVASAAAFMVTASYTSSAKDADPNLSLAERFVSAFYSFDPEPLSEVLAKAGESREDILFYQGWAQGGNYIVMERMPCAPVNENTVSCSITVQDDLVLALGIDFDVTDTFTISFADGVISAVETSSNDPQLYHDARDWVRANRSEWIDPPCRGTENVAPDPQRCVKQMLEGYREYARVNALTPRAPK